MTGAASSPRLVFDWERKCRDLEAEVQRLRHNMVRISDLAHDGQDRDAIHAFGRLATIESKALAALQGEGK